MSELEDADASASAWLQPLPDDSAPCGPDLEYDNDFLALMQAAQGKPESQFGAAEPPDWREVLSLSSALLDRTRDLRVAITWLRANLHLVGYAALAPGLRLVNGLMESQWENLHPLPDPDDGDPYGRVNALTLLRENAGVLGDLHAAVISSDRAVGQLLVGDIEAVLGLGGGGVITSMGKEQVERMLAAAVARAPELRAVSAQAVLQVKALMATANDKLGSDAPDLRPLYQVVNGVVGLLPAEAAAGGAADAVDDSSDGVPDGGTGAANGGVRGRGLSGAVTSRDEALRAIDMVIDYLERAEPTNPAPLFLRRARQLVGHNFLQLMKVLAPDALAEVARVVGVDPDTVESPDGS